MRDVSFPHLAIFLGAVLLAALSQVLLKKAAMRQYDSVWREYLNPQVIFAYALFFLATLIDVVAYRRIPLSLGPILEASAYLYMLIFGAVVFGAFFFGERVTARKCFALALILGGIVLFTLAG